MTVYCLTTGDAAGPEWDWKQGRFYKCGRNRAGKGWGKGTGCEQAETDTASVWAGGF